MVVGISSTRNSCCVGTVKTNLELVSAQRAAASTSKKDISERKKRHFE